MAPRILLSLPPSSTWVPQLAIVHGRWESELWSSCLCSTWPTGPSPQLKELLIMGLFPCRRFYRPALSDPAIAFAFMQLVCAGAKPQLSLSILSDPSFFLCPRGSLAGPGPAPGPPFPSPNKLHTRSVSWSNSSGAYLRAGPAMVAPCRIITYHNKGIFQQRYIMILRNAQIYFET